MIGHGEHFESFVLRLVVPGVIGPEVLPPVENDPNPWIPFSDDEGATTGWVFEVFFWPFVEGGGVAGPPSMVAIST